MEEILVVQRTYGIIDERFWYLPDHHNVSYDFAFPGWDSPLCFGNTHPIHVEFCSGNGSWIAAKAADNPLINWVAIEMRMDRARKIAKKIKRQQLNNLLVICGEAHALTNRFLPSENVSAIYINFPDPWPKRRHEKYRIIQPAFTEDMCRLLKQEGSLTLVTDHAEFSNWVIKELNKNPKLSSHYPAPNYITELPGYGTSYFEELWREKGREIRYHEYRKK